VPDAAEYAYLFMPEWLWKGLNESVLEKERAFAGKMADAMVEFMKATEGRISPALDAATLAVSNGKTGVDDYYLELGNGVGYKKGPLLDERLMEHWEDFRPGTVEGDEELGLMGNSTVPDG